MAPELRSQQPTTSQSHTQIECVNMADLRAMIPAQFDGDRLKLQDFLIDCDSAQRHKRSFSIATF